MLAIVSCLDEIDKIWMMVHTCMQSNMYLYCSTDFICTSYCSFINPLPPKTTILHVEQQFIITAIIRLSITLTVLNVVLKCTTLYDNG